MRLVPPLVRCRSRYEDYLDRDAEEYNGCDTKVEQLTCLLVDVASKFIPECIRRVPGEGNHRDATYQIETKASDVNAVLGCEIPQYQPGQEPDNCEPGRPLELLTVLFPSFHSFHRGVSLTHAHRGCETPFTVKRSLHRKKAVILVICTSSRQFHTGCACYEDQKLAVVINLPRRFPVIHSKHSEYHPSHSDPIS